MSTKKKVLLTIGLAVLIGIGVWHFLEMLLMFVEDFFIDLPAIYGKINWDLYLGYFIKYILRLLFVIICTILQILGVVFIWKKRKN